MVELRKQIATVRLTVLHFKRLRHYGMPDFHSFILCLVSFQLNSKEIESSSHAGSVCVLCFGLGSDDKLLLVSPKGLVIVCL